MNAIVKTEGVALPDPDTMLTMAPDAYVAAVFNPFAIELAHAKVAADNTSFDITTSAGMELAIEQRAIFRNLRISAEKARVERKAPFLKIGKLIDSKHKELAADIAPYEDRFDAAIKAEEDRKEAAKQALVQAELDRIDAIQRNIAAIRNAPAMAMGQPVVLIENIIAKLQSASIDARYGDYIDMATTARAEALEALQTVLANARQVEADRAELAKLRAEKAVQPAQQVAADAIAKARSTPAPEAMSAEHALTTALQACHAVLTGRSNDMAGAIAQAELALLAVGITPDALGLQPE